MNNISVNLDGIPIEIKRIKIPLKQLILDRENPRIQYYLDTRLNDNITQEKIKFALAEGNDQKYPGHADILQIRYSPQNPFAIKLREIFKTSFNYLRKEKPNTKGTIRVPEEKTEYIALYMTPIEDTFFFDHITSSESAEIKESISKINEEDFEYQSNYKEVDDSARVETKEQIVKVRRLDRAIGESLKLFYGYRCQICGDNFAKKYNCVIAEAHHIVFFVSSLNNDASNIIVLCPNHHRIIHKANPIFEREKYSFVYPNGLEEKLILNEHLQSTA